MAHNQQSAICSVSGWQLVCRVWGMFSPCCPASLGRGSVPPSLPIDLRRGHRNACGIALQDASVNEIAVRERLFFFLSNRTLSSLVMSIQRRRFVEKRPPRLSAKRL